MDRILGPCVFTFEYIRFVFVWCIPKYQYIQSYSLSLSATSESKQLFSQGVHWNQSNYIWYKQKKPRYCSNNL